MRRRLARPKRALASSAAPFLPELGLETGLENSLDKETIRPYDVDIVFLGHETPQERAKRIYEAFYPAGRPLIEACRLCQRACKQRAASDAVFLFTCFDRIPISGGTL
jgi:hypothetical protein